MSDTLVRIGDINAMHSTVAQLKDQLALYHNPCPETDVAKLEITGAIRNHYRSSKP